ncbi:MAG TPA: hypothetical protein VF623_02355 [Segetibacter sp.]|jgi:hypothetical protein
MKKLLFIVAISVFASCGGNGGVEAVRDSMAVTPDTLSTGMNTGAMSTDTTGATAMNADTSGMSNAR